MLSGWVQIWIWAVFHCFNPYTGFSQDLNVDPDPVFFMTVGFSSYTCSKNRICSQIFQFNPPPLYAIVWLISIRQRECLWVPALEQSSDWLGRGVGYMEARASNGYPDTLELPGDLTTRLLKILIQHFYNNGKLNVIIQTYRLLQN